MTLRAHCTWRARARSLRLQVCDCLACVPELGILDHLDNCIMTLYEYLTSWRYVKSCTYYEHPLILSSTGANAPITLGLNLVVSLSWVVTRHCCHLCVLPFGAPDRFHTPDYRGAGFPLCPALNDVSLWIAVFFLITNKLLQISERTHSTENMKI